MKNHPKTADIDFLKTGLRKPSFQFLNFEVGSGSVFSRAVERLIFLIPLIARLIILIAR